MTWLSRSHYPLDDEVRDNFVQFHSRWLQHAIEQDWEADISRIMAAIKSRRIAFSIQVKIHNPEGRRAATAGSAQRYKLAIDELRQLRPRYGPVCHPVSS